MIDDNDGMIDGVNDDKSVFFLARSEVRDPANKLEACPSVLIFGGCRSVCKEERRQVPVDHHED